MIKATYIWSYCAYDVRSKNTRYTGAGIGKPEDCTSISRRYISVVDKERAELKATEGHGEREEDHSFCLVITVHIARNNEEYTRNYRA
jgi:hypothetical protein